MRSASCSFVSIVSTGVMAPAFANSGTHSPGSQTTSHAGAFESSVVLTLDRYASRAISSISMLEGPSSVR